MNASDWIALAALGISIYSFYLTRRKHALLIARTEIKENSLRVIRTVGWPHDDEKIIDLHIHYDFNLMIFNSGNAMLFVESVGVEVADTKYDCESDIKYCKGMPVPPDSMAVLNLTLGKDNDSGYENWTVMRRHQDESINRTLNCILSVITPDGQLHQLVIPISLTIDTDNKITTVAETTGKLTYSSLGSFVFKLKNN